MTIDTLPSRLTEIQDWLTKEFSALRTGQASPALLDGVKVDNYGALTPINQVGSIGIEDARTLRISPWDVTQIAALEKAIAEADLGVSIASDSAGLRVIFPELTSERREQIVKTAKAKLEDARVSVRSARDEVMKALEAQEKAGELSKDELFGQKELVQKQIDDTNKVLEAQYAAKETEISA